MTLCEPLGHFFPCLGSRQPPSSPAGRMPKPSSLPEPDCERQISLGSDGAETLYTKVFFRWHLPGIKPNEEVRVIGDCPELGSWQVEHGVPLETDFESASCFRSPGVLLPLQRPVEYQYTLVSRSKGSTARLLDSSQARKRRVVPTGMCHIVEDDDGAFREFDSQGDIMEGVGMHASDSMSSIRERKSSMSLGGATSVFQDADAKGPGSPKVAKATKLDQLKEIVSKEKQLQLTKEDTVIAVFRMLPYRVERVQGGGWRVVEEKKTRKNPCAVTNLLGHSQAEGQQPYNVKFVGQPGVIVDDPEERTEIRRLLAAHNCIPVFLDEDSVTKHLECSHQFLWPVFHNMKVFCSSTDHKFDDAQWKVFKEVNKAYADVIRENVDPKALVWIHDYHLILVARYLLMGRRVDCGAIGFFLHSAFPSSEVLRCIPMRIELLHSMLSCHCVTFQIFEYARHFLTCCKLILHCDYSFQEGGVLQVEHDSRSIVVRTDHVVLPYESLLKRLDQPNVQTRAKSIRDSFPGRTIFASIDGDEPFAGMTLKLRAFETFLSDCPQHRRKVALVQHVLVTKHNDKESAELIGILKNLADQINKRFSAPGEPPCVTINTEWADVDDRMAILSATDILLDTSVNDGLNLYPFMFYCAHAKTSKGAVIVSEFTGCSNVLTGAIKINPWNTKAVMEAMHNALTLEPSEQATMFTKDHSYVSTQTFDGWAYQNLLDLKASQNGSSRQISLQIGFERRFMDCGFRALNFDSVVRDYRQSKGARLIFLDNEGTLSPDRRAVLRYGLNSGLMSSALACDSDTIESLRNLASDQKNIVVVISGREREVLESTEFSQINNLGLCAEHGFYWTLPGRLQSASSSQGKRWHCSMKELSEEDDDWKTICVELFKQYTKRVQGSIIEQRGCAVAWMYHEVSAKDVAQCIAMELARLVDPLEPHGLLYGYPVDVSAGKGYVEVKRSEVNKGKAILRTFKMIQEQLTMPVDFVLCIGNDRSDEDMFEAVSQLKAGKSESSNNLAGLAGSIGGSSGSISGMTPEPTSPSPMSPSLKFRTPPTLGVRKMLASTDDRDHGIGEESQNFYTATVGRKSSKATYFVKDIDAVSNLLQKLAQEGIRTKFSKFSSVPNLEAMAQQAAGGACGDLEAVIESD